MPCTSREVDVAELALVERRSLEDAARSARYRFLREVAQGKPIAVAHHADDQVEAPLLHFLRGSGLPGMVGMLPRQQDIIRPLLEARHAQTVAYCQEHGIEPLEDLSNSDPGFYGIAFGLNLCHRWSLSIQVSIAHYYAMQV